MPAEAKLYPIVERWVKRHFLCFKVETNKGISFGRIDVIGIRDVGGRLTGDIEVIAVEVKQGNFAFAVACGQTLGYNVFANKVYLAAKRKAPFSPGEVQIASHLGIGLIQINKGRCSEILSSPFYNPIPKMNLALLERLRLGRCQVCGCFFETGEGEGKRHSLLTTMNISKAIAADKGIKFYNDEVGWRKHRAMHSKRATWDTDIRFICHECAKTLKKLLLD